MLTFFTMDISYVWGMGQSRSLQSLQEGDLDLDTVIFVCNGSNPSSQVRC